MAYFISLYNDLTWPLKRLKSLDFILPSMTHIKFPWLEQVYMLILTLLEHQVRHFQLKTFLLKILPQQKNNSSQCDYELEEKYVA